MKYELQVAPTHRFAEAPIRTRQGKVWVGKDKVTSIAGEDLLPGEALVIQRLQAEGRLVVVEVAEPLPPAEARTVERKRVRAEVAEAA